MTITARKTLQDLRMSHNLLEVEESTEQFRVLWVASVTICRAVGHVLQKVDSSTSPRLKLAISQAYSSWKADPESNRIFFDFIENERNSVLKEYKFGFNSGPLDILAPDGSLFTLDNNIFCPLIDGHFSGEDCRDVLELAIVWWQTQLDFIDCMATA